MKSNLLPRVKLSVDTIYELTRNGWVEVSMKSFGDHLLPKVSAELIKRKVLEHKAEFGGKHFYRWVAESEPTACFYKSVAKVLLERQRGYNKRRDEKNAAMKAAAVEREEPVVVPEEAPAEKVPEFVEKAFSLADVPSQELWDELKRRGAEIEDGRLVIVKRDFLS